MTENHEDTCPHGAEIAKINHLLWDNGVPDENGDVPISIERRVRMLVEYALLEQMQEHCVCGHTEKQHNKSLAGTCLNCWCTEFENGS